MAMNVKDRIAVVCIMKNEAPYILEWISWYRSIGFNDIIIYNNESMDGSTDILESLYKEGIIRYEYIKSNTSGSTQARAYEHAINKYKEEIEWILFVDADEFLILSDIYENVKEYISTIPQNIGGIAINWAIYGSSGRVAPGEGTVMRRFVNRARKDFFVNHHYKSLVKCAAIEGKVDNVHHINLAKGYIFSNPKFEHLSFFNGQKGLSENIEWENARLNHYVIKSWLEFWEKKSARGTADGTINDRNEDFFYGHDRNECFDPPRKETIKTTEVNIEKIMKNIRTKVENYGKNLHVKNIFGGNPVGFIDNVITVDEKKLIIAGWMISPIGGQEKNIKLIINNEIAKIIETKRIRRPDVVAAYGCYTEMVGFETLVEYDDLRKKNIKIVLTYVFKENIVSEYLLQR